MIKKYIGIFIILAITTITTGCISVSKVDIATLNQKAAEYMEKGDYDNAICRLVAINDLEDTHPEVYYNLGVAYIKKENYELATEAFKRAIELKSDMVEAYYSLGVAYELWTDSQIEELKNATTNAEKFKIKTNLAQNIQNVQNAYAAYLQIAPEGIEKNQIKNKLEQLPLKYKSELSTQSQKQNKTQETEVQQEVAQ